MPMHLKVLIVESSGIKTIPLDQYDRLRSGAPSLSFPQYAGKRQRAALAVVETSRSGPPVVSHIDYVLLPFDVDGRLRQDELRRAKWLAVNDVSVSFGTSEPEIEMGPYVVRGRYRKDFLWSPSPNEAEAVKRAAVER